MVWGDLELAPPFITFQDRLDLFVDDLKLELHYMGPAHTTNDVVVWLPERRLLFTGDLVFNGGTPFVAMGSIAGSLDALEQTAQLRCRNHSDTRSRFRFAARRCWTTLKPTCASYKTSAIVCLPTPA